MTKLLASFTQFFRENADAYSAKLDYQESFPHLLLMAFLQRIINGGGKIRREYALGRKRVDLFIEWKNYSYIPELKIKRGEDTERKGLEQIAEYVDPHLETIETGFISRVIAWLIRYYVIAHQISGTQ